MSLSQVLTGPNPKHPVPSLRGRECGVPQRTDEGKAKVHPDPLIHSIAATLRFPKPHSRYTTDFKGNQGLLRSQAQEREQSVVPWEAPTTYHCVPITVISWWTFTVRNTLGGRGGTLETKLS